MSIIEKARRQLVAANRILANEGVIDAYGHVSVRHPERQDRFLLSRSRSPQFVASDDIMEFELDGTPVDDSGRAPYLERYIHGSLYAAKPEARSVIHAHTESVLPYTISDVPLRAVTHDAHDTGEGVPVWEIRDGFGDGTDLLVSNREMGDDLAARFGGDDRVVLMRGHGFALWNTAISAAVRASIYLAKNAEVQTIAQAMGAVTPLSAGEIHARRTRPAFQPDSPAMRRSWEYWAERAGCADLIAED